MKFSKICVAWFLGNVQTSEIYKISEVCTFPRNQASPIVEKIMFFNICLSEFRDVSISVGGVPVTPGLCITEEPSH